MPYYNENAKIIGGSNNLGGGLIEWVKQCYYLNDEYPYEIMEKDAAESDIGARGLVFLPFLLGSGLLYGMIMHEEFSLDWKECIQEKI